VLPVAGESERFAFRFVLLLRSDTEGGFSVFLEKRFWYEMSFSGFMLRGIRTDEKAAKKCSYCQT